MLYNVYAVQDKLAGEAGPPFIAVNDQVALRQYKSMGIPGQLKNEYSLVKIGYYDSVKMSIIPDIVIELITELQKPEVSENDNI